MADETPAPLSDAEIAEIQTAWQRADARARDEHRIDGSLVAIGRLLATLAARDAGLAALREREAAERELVAAVARVEAQTVSGTLVKTYPDMEALRASARAVLAGTPAPGTTGVAGEEVCDLCDGTGVYVGEIAWENPDGTVGTETKRTTCHGCNGTGKRKSAQQPAD